MDPQNHVFLYVYTPSLVLNIMLPRIDTLMHIDAYCGGEILVRIRDGPKKTGIFPMLKTPYLVLIAIFPCNRKS